MPHCRKGVLLFGRVLPALCRLPRAICQCTRASVALVFVLVLLRPRQLTLIYGIGSCSGVRREVLSTSNGVPNHLFTSFVVGVDYPRNTECARKPCTQEGECASPLVFEETRRKRGFFCFLTKHDSLESKSSDEVWPSITDGSSCHFVGKRLKPCRRKG